MSNMPKIQPCSTIDTRNAEGPLSRCGGPENSEMGEDDRMFAQISDLR
jgi:hypothetical protein